MADPRFQTSVQTRTRDEAVVDEGLRAYMLRVYNYMAMGLGLTGVIAYVVSTSPAIMQAIFGSGLMWVAILAPLAVVFFLSFRINAMKPATAQAAFWLYAALNGVAFSILFIAYTQTSIARVFFITAGTFAALSLYGYTTKRDLSGWGSFLYMGLIGIIIAMVVNFFMASSALHFAISVIGVLVFTGLTAYDTQKIKEMYYAGDEDGTATKKAIMGALRLYLDFVNLFLMLLHLFGNRE
jgi:FtsH-binding integral membrane protein